MQGLSTIVINLDADSARRAHMQKELGRVGIAFERFVAVRGEDLPAKLRPYFMEEGASRRILSAGEIGCYASHLAVCQRIAAGELAAPVLVLEDDVCLADDFVAGIEAVRGALPAEWDLVRLSNDAKHACLAIADIGPRKLVRYSNVPGSAGAILWNRSGAQKFLRQCARTLPVDQDLRLVWAWDLDTYGVVPAPALRDRCGASRIDAMAPAGWRNDARRTRLVRGARTHASLQRHLHGLKAFGVRRWLAAETINLVAPLRRGARVLLPAREQALN